MTQEEYSGVCPYLGLADDADSHATYPTEAHRCYRLPNPTRIATPHQETYCLGSNHVTCPVYLGEGVPKAPLAAAAAAPFRPAPEPAGTVRGPQGRAGAGRGRNANRQPEEAAAVATPRPGRRAQSPGQLGPRPRSGGVSMPVATVALFALALVVIVLAFVIQNVVGGDGDGDANLPADVVATNQALQATRTAQAGTPGATQPAGAATTPANNQTPGTATTPNRTTTTTASPTGAAGGENYTVASGDTCGAIASREGVTTAALIAANPAVNAECSNLQVGQVLRIP